MAINKTKINNNSQINAIAIRQQVEKGQTELVNFSFKYLNEKAEKFIYSNKDGRYFTTLKERLKAISGMSITELYANRSGALRCHPINFVRTSEPDFGIPQEEQIATQPYQFSISANQDGRVHGFIIKNTFYIVWLDPDHHLYPQN